VSRRSSCRWLVPTNADHRKEIDPPEKRMKSMGDALWVFVKKMIQRRAVVLLACVTFINVYGISLLRKATSLKWKSEQSLKWKSEQLALHQLTPHTTNEVLVIVIGSLRGGAVAWDSFNENVLDALGADLAYLGPDNTSDTFTRGLAYDWHFDDLLDWGDFFDDLDPSGNWRRMCSERPKGGSQFLGGVANCQEGSAGILLAYRELAYQRIVRHNLREHYKWFVLTRSDHLYLCPHFPLTDMSQDSIHVVEGEDYGGTTDRHTVMPSKHVLRALNLTNYILANWTYIYSEFACHGRHINLEGLLKHYFDEVHLTVERFPRTFFAVKRDCDETRWSTGVDHPIAHEYGLRVKYMNELLGAEQRCNTTWRGPNVTNTTLCP